MSNGPVGPTILVPGRYTHCVQRENYEPLPKPIIDVGPASMGKAACDYLLGGKLICLSADDQCAFGHVIGIEPVGYHKPFPQNIDNDFCFNVLLSPWSVTDFSSSTDRQAAQDRVRTDGTQGWLIADPNPFIGGPLPPATEPDGNSPNQGYGATWLFGSGPPEPWIEPEDPTDLALEETKQKAAGIKQIEVPVLHCECEGSRIYFVCSAVSPFLDIMSGKPPGFPGPSASEICHDVLGWIPFVGDLVCSIAELLVDVALLPLTLAAAAAASAAWAAAEAFDDAFITGPISGEIALGDVVIVSGGWVWDGGHAGYNEIHPVKTVQKIVLPPELESVGTVGEPDDGMKTVAKDFHDRWCDLVQEAPPIVWPGLVPQDLTPEQLATLTPTQQGVYGVQQQPKEQWTIHPLVDGCVPSDEPGEAPIPK